MTCPGAPFQTLEVQKLINGRFLITVLNHKVNIWGGSVDGSTLETATCRRLVLHCSLALVCWSDRPSASLTFLDRTRSECRRLAGPLDLGVRKRDPPKRGGARGSVQDLGAASGSPTVTMPRLMEPDGPDNAVQQLSGPRWASVIFKVIRRGYEGTLCSFTVAATL